jgi:hypothetical protein
MGSLQKKIGQGSIDWQELARNLPGAAGIFHCGPAPAAARVERASGPQDHRSNETAVAVH